MENGDVDILTFDGKFIQLLLYLWAQLIGLRLGIKMLVYLKLCVNF